MRILVVSQYFWPEHFRINELSAALAASGHEVTVLTGIPNYPNGQVFPGYRCRLKARETHEGVEVVRVPLVPRGSAHGARLALNYLSFAGAASLLGPLYCRGPFDIVFTCQLSPATVAIPAMVLKRLRRVPMVMWTLDLWPESLSGASGVSNRHVIWAVGAFMKLVYRQCDRILVSSRGFGRKLAERGVPESKLEYFPNWVEEVGAEEQTGPTTTLPAGFRLLFAGNIGAAQDFPTILDAAEKLRQHPDIHWMILGDGRLAGWVSAEVERRALGRTVHLYGRKPPEAMPAYFDVADAMLVTLKHNEAFALTVPGKIPAYMASRKPIIAALDGEGGELVSACGCGIACPAQNPDALAAAVLNMYRLSRQEREEMGQRGMAYAAEHFNRMRLFQRLNEVLSDVAGSGKAH